MNLLKKYNTLLIPLFFLLGFIIPFNGWWISGIFYFTLSWIGFFAFITDFQVEYLKHIHLLFAHAIPIFTTFTFYCFLFFKLFPSKFFSWLIKINGVLSIISYLCFIYANIQDILLHDFSLSFFNQSLWFFSSLMCLLFSTSKETIINSGENSHAIHQVSKN